MEADRLTRDTRRMHLPDRMTPEYRAELLRARWRCRNGLEARALVALARSPAALVVARDRIMSDDFLTPAYAVGAALLLAADPDSRVLELIRDSLDARPYLPELSPTEWEAEALQLIEELVHRRERWAVEKR